MTPYKNLDSAMSDWRKAFFNFEKMFYEFEKKYQTFTREIENGRGQFDLLLASVDSDCSCSA
jgi:hypothetical protein